MAKSPTPSKPWTDLGCDPLDMVQIVGATVRGDVDFLLRTFRNNPQTPQVIEMLAARHRAGPFLALTFNEMKVWDSLPEPAQQRLQKSLDLQEDLAARCFAHLNELDELLRSSGIDYLLLKGPEIGVRFGKGPAGRAYRDIDVLVRQRERSAVCQLLEKAGHFRLSRHFLGLKASAVFNHGTDYVKDDRLLDLHWAISKLPGVRIDSDKLFESAQSVEVAGRSVKVASPPEELGILLVSSFADIQRGYLRLQAFIDIASVAATIRPEEWSSFFSARENERTSTICRAVLHLVVSVFSLQECLQGLEAHLPIVTPARDAVQILLPSPGGRKAKLWALQHLPVGPLRYLGWWLVSLPFRVTASHPLFRRKYQATTKSKKRASSGCS